MNTLLYMIDRFISFTAWYGIAPFIGLVPLYILAGLCQTDSQFLGLVLYAVFVHPVLFIFVIGKYWEILEVYSSFKD